MAKRDIPLIDGALVDSSPRYADWSYILDGDSVPLLSTQKSTSDAIEVYPLAVKRLRPVQRNRLAEHIVRAFEISLPEAYRRVDSGFMIRCEDVILAKPKRSFL